MNHGKRWKVILAPLVGLAATVAVLFLLSTPNTRAAMPTVNRTADGSAVALRGYEWITATTSRISARPVVSEDNQPAGDDTEACTIAVATGGSSRPRGRPADAVQ